MASKNQALSADMAFVSLRWNGDCLAALSAAAGEEVALGDGEGALAPLPAKLLGASRLVIADAAGGAHVLVPEGKVAVIRGASGRGRLVAGPARERLARDEEATLLFGEFEVAIAAHAKEPSPKRRRVAVGAWAHTAMVAAVHAALLFAGSRAALASSLEREAEPDLDRLRGYLAAAEQRSAAPDAPAQSGTGGKQDAKHANGRNGDGKNGGGAKHEGEAGAAGATTSRAKGERWGATAQPRQGTGTPAPDDLEVARSFGMVALLGGAESAGRKDADGVPLRREGSPWGASDPFAAMGSMLSRVVGEAQGSYGLALSGIGEGGGGRGEGIGLGAIGTIGHADGLAGIGTGGAGSEHRSTFGWSTHDGWGREHIVRPPRMWGGACCSVSGRLPPESVRRVIRSNFGRFRGCYQEGLLRNPSLVGRVSTSFVIGSDGAVSSVSDAGSDLPDAKVKACVIRAFYGLSFPQPEGGIVTVIYPILFSNDG
jgi:hypothetical protein